MKTSAVTMLAVALALAGCGDKPAADGEAGTAVPSGEGTAARAAPGDAVPAVQMSTGTPVAKLSYVVETRPLKGVPFNVSLLVSAGASIPVLEVAASSTTLEVVPATGVLTLEGGKPATHELTITAAGEGLAEFTVSLKTEGAAEAVYAIPVLVMAAQAAPAQKPDGG
jgi:hypothetical protein